MYTWVTYNLLVKHYIYLYLICIIKSFGMKLDIYVNTLLYRNFLMDVCNIIGVIQITEHEIVLLFINDGILMSAA